jgi:hypothetical protein
VVEIAQMVVECGQARRAVPGRKPSPATVYSSENTRLRGTAIEIAPFGKLLALFGVE